jgi:hypothetical protein
MFKKSLIALAALALCYVLAALTIAVLTEYLAVKVSRDKLIIEVAALSGASFDRVEDFLVMIENVGVEVTDYSAADLANALTNGFVFKLTEAS